MKSFLHLIPLMIFSFLLSASLLSAQMMPQTPLNDTVKPTMKKGSEFQSVYVKPKINQELFVTGISMTDLERDEYATNLTAHAVARVRADKGDDLSLKFARKLIALSLHLSPRNKKAIVVNAQLNRQVMPEPVSSNYEKTVFSNIIFARGQLLESELGEGNDLLARCFITIAAILNPRNEDAVFEAEIRRIDHGEIKWELITGA